MKLVFLTPSGILFNDSLKRGNKMDENKNRRTHERVPYHEFSEAEEMPGKRIEGTKPSKFIQIAAGNEHLYALDELGRVWSYNTLDKEWNRAGDTRK
jgi:alpha-tubulin suppressor-like RCC1 family protein